jgi:hypothetical protein
MYSSGKQNLSDPMHFLTLKVNFDASLNVFFAGICRKQTGLAFNKSEANLVIALIFAAESEKN